MMVLTVETEIVVATDNSIVTWVIMGKNKYLMIKGIGQTFKYETKLSS